MSNYDPSNQKVKPWEILKINVRFVFACLILFYGWLCWQMASIEWWGFYLLGPMCFVAGSTECIAGIKRAWEAISKHRTWKRFQKLGNRPKADGMVQDRDFDMGGRS